MLLHGVSFGEAVLTFMQLLQEFVACRLILCINSVIGTTAWTALNDADLTASEKYLWMILACAICESREECCCCICIWSFKLLVLRRSGRDFYILFVSIGLTSACHVDSTQLNTRKKISIYSNLRVPICEVRRVAYREDVLPGGKRFRYCGTQSLVLLQTAGKKNDHFHTSL